MGYWCLAYHLWSEESISCADPTRTAQFSHEIKNLKV